MKNLNTLIGSLEDNITTEPILISDIPQSDGSKNLQERSIHRLLRFWREKQTGPTLVKLTFQKSRNWIWISVQTERTDCEKFSERAVLTQDGGYYCVTRRGKLTLHHTYHVCSTKERLKNHLQFLAKMVSATLKTIS